MITLPDIIVLSIITVVLGLIIYIIFIYFGWSGYCRSPALCSQKGG